MTAAWPEARAGPSGSARPTKGRPSSHDVVRGEVEFPNDAMDDFVVVKANGAPLFVLANVVDDMRHGHHPRDPRRGPAAHHAQGGAAVGGAGRGGLDGRGRFRRRGPVPAPPLPVFAHLPMLVNEQRKKLSKRRDPVAVESYRDQGYLPDAFVNYLALLGWSPPGGEEIFDRRPDDRLVPRWRT